MSRSTSIHVSTPSTPSTPAPVSDDQRRRALSRMRMVAVSLLVFAAVVYVATLGREGALGFVNAGAEASMVGAIADWFAVTALFRHPLGLPIPHTALIPRRKDELGRGLQEFVGENFLSEEVIRGRIDAATVSARLGEWLGDSANARKVVHEAADVLAIGLSKVREDHVEALIKEALVPRFLEEPISPLLGGFLSEALEDNVHHGLVDLALVELRDWLIANPGTVQDVIEERAPWWAPPSLNDRVTGRIHREMVRWVADIASDPHHHARGALDSMLGQLARDLLGDASTQQRAEQLKERLLEHPAVLGSSVSLWNALRRVLTASLADPEGAVRARMLQEISAFADRLGDDTSLRARLDLAVADAAVFGMERYGSELTTVISHTIEAWDGKEAASRIELHVGRDLQFIRINGTIVGGLVGVLIHLVAVLFG